MTRSSAPQCVLTIGLVLVSLQGITGQVLSFHGGAQRDEQHGNWTAAGKLKLANKDYIILKPVVKVQAVSEVCTINLESCVAKGQAPPTSNACYCKEVSEADFDLFVSGGGDHPAKELTVQATVPTYYPLSLSERIVTIPGAGQVWETVKPQSDQVKTLVAKLEKSEQKKGEIEAKLKKREEKNVKLEAKLKKTEETVIQLETQLMKRNERTYNPLSPNICSDVHTSDPRPVMTTTFGRQVVCDTTTDNGGWIVIQRRTSSAVDFYRGWTEYKNGFGVLPSNFWLGLETLYRLTTKSNWELRVDFVHKNQTYFAQYNHFKILGEEYHYKLEVSGYSGNAGDSLKYHNGKSFSTMDHDRDTRTGNCAETFHGAWWYGSCHNSNLNGLWGSTAFAKGVVWYTTTTNDASATFSEMKIRPRGA